MRALALVLAVTALATVSASARAEGHGALELGARLGYQLPLGGVTGASGDDLNKYATGGVPLWLGVGWRATPNIYVGVFYVYGFGFLAKSSQTDLLGCSAPGTSCSTHDVQYGVEAHYHFLPDAIFDPWLGIGIGADAATISVSSGNNSGSDSASGLTYFIVQGGSDYKITPSFALGPWVSFSLGQYGTLTGETNGSSLSQSINNTTLHEWLMLGARGVFDIGL